MTKERIIEIIELNQYDISGYYEQNIETDVETSAEEIYEEFEAEKQELIEVLKMAIKVYKYCEKFAAYSNLPMDFVKLLDLIDIESILEKHTGKTIKELLNNE